ncbi:ABC transporter permease [Streptomyces varsoviensis]|uniref:ABC transporter permease n=1 Tax=Streptomyces varsoviensis TaxID=67373 RepID=UPI00340CFB16
MTATATAKTGNEPPTGAAPRAAPDPHRSPVGGVTWLVLRQHRLTLWIAAVAFLALVIELVWLRTALTDYVRTTARHCADTGGQTDCVSGALEFQTTYGDLLYTTGQFIGFLPLLFGLFVAGPMIARELESGTYQLAWTQSVSPMRWFAAKLAVPAVLAVTGVTALSALHTWAWWPVQDLLPGRHWYQGFDELGVVPVAYALLGVAVGATAGLLIKRTLVSIGVTLVGFTALNWAFSALLPHLAESRTKVGKDFPGLGSTDWGWRRGYVTAGGGHLPEETCAGGSGAVRERCLADHHIVGGFRDYHPASQFWTLQWTQAALVAAVAVAFAWFAVWWMRRGHR